MAANFEISIFQLIDQLQKQISDESIFIYYSMSRIWSPVVKIV